VSRGPDRDVPPDKILAYMDEHPDPGFTAREIAENFDKTRQWADKQLRDMENDNLITSKNPGGRSKWYWVTTGGKKLLKQQNGD